MPSYNLSAKKLSTIPFTDIKVATTDKLGFGTKPTLNTHNLQSMDLFTDAALIDLLDNFPRQHLYAINMGSNPTCNENRLALHDGVSGKELLEAVKHGRLWLNITRVDRADQRYRDLINQLYAQLSLQLPSFKPLASQGTLLLSSPHAMVYYHADGPASLLWHIRGRKRVWVYPALDSQYLPSELLEDIFAGVRHEYIPYQHSFDHAAVVYDLEPGQWLSWPQNAPHRITNFDSVNVSLVTEHFTTASRRRACLYTANRYCRTKLGWSNLSLRERGPAAFTKILLHRLAAKIGLDMLHYKHHIPSLRIDANAPGGVVALDVAHAGTSETTSPYL